MQIQTKSWDLTASLLLVTISVQLILLLIAFIYNKKIIVPNKEKLFWKIRRPKYFLFYIVITLLNDIVRCFNSLLVHLNIINIYQYSLISVPMAYYGGITWGSVRLYLLYYDIKIAKKNQLFLLSKHLNVTSSQSLHSTNNNKKPYKLKKYQSVTIKMIIIVTIFCLITLCFDIFLGLTAISKLILYGFIGFLLIFYTYFICTMCGCCCYWKCCKSNKNTLKTSPFRDDWLLLSELTIIWIIWIIGIIGGIFLSLPLRNNSFQSLFIAILTMMTRTIITLTMFILPYKVFVKLNKNNNQSTTILTLQNVLSTKIYFFHFVEHLVQELAIENLTFLVELWQYKNEEKYHLKSSKMEEIERSNIMITTPTDSHYEDNEWLKKKIANIEYEHHNNKATSIWKRGRLQSDTEKTNHNKKSVKSVDFLQSLPWSSLPLSQSISLHLSLNDNNNNNNNDIINIDRKWDQCYEIFMKYLNENSYDSINISCLTRNRINTIYNDLLQYKHFKNGYSLNGDNDKLPNIKNDEEFNEKLMNVFDAALSDIIQNLRDSLTRFVLSDNFVFSSQNNHNNNK